MKKLKELALPAAVSALFGVTEPATYAIVMPRMKYLVVTCVSSAIACGVGGHFWLRSLYDSWVWHL